MIFHFEITKFKKVVVLAFCLSEVLFCCNKNASSDLIKFDVNGNFPVKTLDIQDIADIEYLKLEINDDYLFSDFVLLTDSFVICRGKRTFIFFNRTTGKPVSKLNRYGNGPEEYNLAVVYVYSEIKDEFFILDYPTGIKVYGKDGTFKRKIPCKEDFHPSGINSLYDYDEDHLLLNGYSFKGGMKDTSFILISKQDGFIEGIHIPYEKKVNLIFIKDGGGTVAKTYFAVRNCKDYLLTDYSSDTVYLFTPERKLTPVLVRTPSIQKMDSKILLHSWLETDKFLFFSIEKLEFDWNSQTGFPTKGYLMEKCSGKFFQTGIRMRDYEGKELIIDPSVIDRIPNRQTGIIALSALELRTANKENKLSGELKEATDRLTEDDEYIFMILKFK